MGEARCAARAPAAPPARSPGCRRTRARRCRAAGAPPTGSTGCAAPPAAWAGSREIESQTTCPSIITLSYEPSSPVRNSSSSASRSGAGGAASSHTRRSSASSRRNVLLAPAPAGGLTTSGKPTSAAKPAAASAESASRCRAQGTPAARSTDFICALSRKLRAVAASMPGMPRCSRTCASGTCSCSSTPKSRCTGPTLRAERLGRRRRSARRRAGRRSASARPGCAAAPPGRGLSGSQVISGQLDVRQPGRGLRRTASSRRAGRARRRRRPPCLEGYPASAERSPPAAPGRNGNVLAAPASMPGMNVVFVEPFFPANQRHFARALAEAGATVIGIGEYSPRRAGRPAQGLDAPLRAGAVGHRRRGDDPRGPLGAGQAVGRPARGHDRGAHPGRRRRSGRRAPSRARRCGRPGCAATSRR